MNRFAEWSHQWIFYIMSGLFWGSALLRSLVAYRVQPVFALVAFLLLAFLILYAIEELAARSSWFFPIYLLIQIILIVLLLRMPYPTDYFAVLFAVLSMQVFQRLRVSLGAIFLGFFAFVIIFILAKTYGLSQALALAGVYSAASLFTAFYALTSRRAQEASLQNLSLAEEIASTNHELQNYSDQMEQMAVTRERHKLARDLHDSVTQTIFSMTLTTQSALLLLNRDPSRVGTQLIRLNQLTQHAISEMQTLITELGPDQTVKGGLAATIRRHLAERHFPEDLRVNLTEEGAQSLTIREEQSLFRIVQEALNNVIKHSDSSKAEVHLHLADPFWIEVTDLGQGFDLQKARRSGRVGLESMEERAEEIGWYLLIFTGLGSGTRIRVEKKQPTERLAG
jgi:signal transduction histidine kinase